MNHPLMKNNITSEDRQALISFLQTDPILTNSNQVKKFEEEWSKWLGVKYSVMVNSGSSANFLTMSMLKEKFSNGEILVPALTWVSDIASILWAGFKPIFVDINPKTLAMDMGQIRFKKTSQTRAIFLTHILGLSGMSEELLKYCRENQILLIEDVCESHGAKFENKKLGCFGALSNFSFYYAHHLTTIEGGMVCTDNEEFYQMARMLRSHGMVREASGPEIKDYYQKNFPSLHPDFIFAHAGFNFRPTEINAVLGLNQLKRLNTQIEKRNENFKLFLQNLDKNKFVTDFNLNGQSSYAFILVLKEKNNLLMNNVLATLEKNQVEYRRGTSGGGNQLRQPYLQHLIKKEEYINYPVTEHIHFFGLYLGNYPELEENQILNLCHQLNKAEG